VGLKRFVFLTDVHGDMQDAGAVNAALSFARDFRPHYKICGGDVWDFRALRGKASEEEKRESLKEDFDAGMRFLEAFSPTHFLRGNHDERLWDAAARSNGPLSDYARELADRAVRELPGEVRPYHKRLGTARIGQLAFLHGYFAGISAARSHAQVYGSCVYGHVHATDSSAAPGIDRRVAYGVGCLCTLDFDYDKKSPGTLRHSQGFAYGVIDDKTGAFSVQQAERVEGKFYVASEIRAVA
jgi:hypothetical protein